MEGEKPYLVHLKFAEHSDNERKMRVKKKDVDSCSRVRLGT